MKKRLLSIIALLVALMLVVLTGCEKEVERKKSDKKSKGETTESISEENTDDTTEAGEGNIAPDKDNSGKKPVSGSNSGITSSDDFFDENAGKNDKESTDYIEEIVNDQDKYADEDDIEIVKSGEFIMAVRQVDAKGVVSVIRIARKGNNMAMFMDSPEEKMGIIFAGENIHMVMTDEKAYITLPMEMLGMDSETLMAEFSDSFDFSDAEEENEKIYTEVIDGVEYTVHESEDGLKDYYIGNKIIMGETEDGGMMYVDELSGTVPASVFEVPAGYREMSITEFAELMQ